MSLVKLDDNKIWSDLRDKCHDLKSFNCDIKNYAHIISNDYIEMTTETKYNAVKSSDIRSFMIDNHINDLVLYGFYDIDIFTTIKLNELRVSGWTHSSNWPKLINWVKMCEIKKVHLNFRLSNDDLKYILELLKIKTLVAIKIRLIDQIPIELQNLILDGLEKNYKILDFSYNSSLHIGGDVLAILERNMVIRDDWIHYKVLYFAITLCPLIDIGFGTYVLLEIFDWIGWNYLANHRLKIGIIENVCKFRRIKMGCDQ